jgi:hypothetical protein
MGEGFGPVGNQVVGTVVFIAIVVSLCIFIWKAIKAGAFSGGKCPKCGCTGTVQCDPGSGEYMHAICDNCGDITHLAIKKNKYYQ